MTSKIEVLRANLASAVMQAEADYLGAADTMTRAKTEFELAKTALAAHDAAVEALSGSGAGNGRMANVYESVPAPRAPRRSMAEEIEKLLRSSPRPMAAPDIVKMIEGLRLKPAEIALGKLREAGKVVERDGGWTVPAG